jgi:putative ABC transport system substrate-binding protein
VIDRRTFLAGTGAVLLAAPLAGDAQTLGKQSRVGVLGGNPIDPIMLEMFKQGLSQVGSIGGHQIQLVQRDAGDMPTRLPAVVAELVRAGVEVIFARGPGAVAAAVEATKTIPIVAVDLESDPIALGYARTLARPGGNVTGVFLDLPELSAKQLQLIREAFPKLSLVALVGDSTGNAAQLRATEHAAEVLGVRVRTLEGRTAAELDAALETARRMRAGAVLIFSSPAVFAQRTRLAVLGREKRLPTVSLFGEFAEAGGLLTYGPSLRECFRRSGLFAGKILDGAKPGELPIERPEKFELIINLKTPKALGLTIPPSLLQRADEVIE